MTLTSEDLNNYKLTQGDTKKITCSYLTPNPSNPAQMIPFDLTGCQIEYLVTDVPAGKVYSTSLIGSGITVTNQSGGIFAIKLTAIQTQSYPIPKAYYQLKITDQYGDKFTLSQGYILVNPGSL